MALGVPSGELRGVVINCSAVELLQSVKSGGVGAIITDPPFFIPVGRSPSGMPNKDFNDPWTGAATIEEAVNEVKPVVAECARTLRAGGALIVMGQGISATAWDYVVRSSGLNWMAELVVLWNTGKPRISNFGSLFTRINWYSKPGSRHVFNSGDKRSIYSNVMVCNKVPLTERYHPAEKPVGLTNALITLLTNADDLVVDPYCGSGSTLVSAAMCDRDWLGSDTDAEHVRVASRRVAHFELEDVDEVHLWVNGKLGEI